MELKLLLSSYHDVCVQKIRKVLRNWELKNEEKGKKKQLWKVCQSASQCLVKKKKLLRCSFS